MDKKVKKIISSLNYTFSVYVLLVIGFVISREIPLSIKYLLYFSDLLATLFFQFVFFYYLFQSKEKSKYLLIYGVDFLSAIPVIFFLWLPVGRETVVFLRLLRVFVLLRLIVFRAAQKKNITNLLQSLFVLNILFITLLSFCIFIVEHNVNPAFASYFDALWFGIVSVSTIGYGDVVPITLAGRFFSISLMVSGIALFSALTAYLSSLFVYRKELTKIASDFSEIRKLLNEIKNK